MKFFDHEPLVVTIISAKDGARLMLEFEEPMPRVILVTDKLLHEWDTEAPSLEELGYVAYDRDISMRATYYARRPWVWLLKAHIQAKQELWRVFSWAYGRVWHLKREAFSQPFRWRDVRLGSGVLQEERLATAELVGRVHELRAEVDELKSERLSVRMRDEKAGWDQHQRALENYLTGGMTAEQPVARLRPEEEESDAVQESTN